MNALTVNIHLLLSTFYKPNAKRFKILIESQAFSSDYHAVASQIEWHGLNVSETLVEIAPRKGEQVMRLEDILDSIDKHSDSLSLVWLGGINYYSGQVLDMAAIAKKAHDYGIMAGFDLAHAVGNIEMNLHDWNVDFATWCSYKYLNSGPGGVSGIFIHENANTGLPAMRGWWGTEENSRFKMSKEFLPAAGAEAWQLSNAPILSMAAHHASLEIFAQAGMKALRQKSLQLTALLIEGIEILQSTLPVCDLQIITPLAANERGCQLSLIAPRFGKELFTYLQLKNVVADWREPDVIRVAPVPLYNTFQEVYEFLSILERFYIEKT